MVNKFDDSNRMSTLDFFSCQGRPLFAMLCEPGEGGQRTAVVICHSLGLEFAVSYRMLALLARRAAGLGYPALLYHSRGHGDSAGDFTDVTFETLVEDALAAADYVRERLGTSRIIWLGVRFGCLVAGEAAARSDATAGVALWEPVHHGLNHFRQLLRGLLYTALAHGKSSLGTVNQLLERLLNEGELDVYGTRLGAELYRSASDVALSSLLSSWNGPTLVAQIQPRLGLSADNSALVEALVARGAAVKVLQMRDDPNWQFPLWMEPWVSSDILDGTERWLNALD
jgi:pimeloyl-ACP methyl ester carboxylesterase